MSFQGHMIYLTDPVLYHSQIWVSSCIQVLVELMIDRDGTMDIIFPTCSRYPSSTGLGHDCGVNVAYNKQIPTCSSEASKFNSDGKITCRGHGDMCQSDPDYAFDFTSNEVSRSIMP